MAKSLHANDRRNVVRSAADNPRTVWCFFVATRVETRGV